MVATAVTTAQSPARSLGGGAATGYPWPEAQGEGAQDQEDSRARPVNPAGRGRGPRRPVSWTPPPLGPKPHTLPGPNSAPGSLTVSSGLSSITQAWPARGLLLASPIHAGSQWPSLL